LAEWNTNVTLDELADWIRAGERFAILTHTKPDGDAIGSTLALVRTLRAIAGDPTQIRASYMGPVPLWLASIAFEDEHDQMIVPTLEALDPDRVLIADTGSWSQLRDATGFLEGRAERIAVIDHHLAGNAEIAQRRFIETSSAAVCQPVARLCAKLLGVGGIESLPAEIAEPLYLGIATDTGWFRHSNVSARVMRDAGALLEAGVDHSKLYQCTEQQDPPQRVVLLGRVLAGMELLLDGRLAVLRILLRDVHETHIPPGQTGGFGDQAMNIASVRVCATLTETDEQPALTKISLRSKEGPDAVNVAQVAEGFGGGGHARAAGARAPGQIEEVAAGLVDAIRNALE